MEITFYVFVSYLLLVTATASDTHSNGARSVNQTVEATGAVVQVVDTEDENTAFTVGIFVPPVSDTASISDEEQVLLDDNGEILRNEWEVLPPTLDHQITEETVPLLNTHTSFCLDGPECGFGSGTIASVEHVPHRRNVTDAPVVHIVNSRTTDVSTEDEDGSTQVYDQSEQLPLGTVLTGQDENSVPSRVDSNENRTVFEDQDTRLNSSQLDLSIAEKSSTPGHEFLDIFDESGYTLRDLEGLLIRHQVHEALHIFRSHQFDVKGRRSGVEKKVNRDVEDTSLIGPDKEFNELLTQKNIPDVDHCSTNPCKNDGTCIDDGEYYRCKCSSNWITGKNCDTDNGPCGNNDCDIHGTRSCYYVGPGGSEHKCICNVGFDGERCETKHGYA